MTKQEFLDELKQALSGEVPADVMMDSYRYYANYIEEEMRKGRTETEILEELGKPALIARSIIAAQSGERTADVEYTEDGRTRNIKWHESARQKTSSEKVHKEFVFDFNAWYAKVLYVAILVVLVLLVYFILKLGFWVLVTFGIPILIVLGILYLILYFLR